MGEPVKTIQEESFADCLDWELRKANSASLSQFVVFGQFVMYGE